MTHTFHRTLLDDDHLWLACRTALGARIIPAPSNDAAPSHSPTLTPERLASALNPQPDLKALTTTRRCLTVVTRDRPICVRCSQVCHNYLQDPASTRSRAAGSIHTDLLGLLNSKENELYRQHKSERRGAVEP